VVRRAEAAKEALVLRADALVLRLQRLDPSAQVLSCNSQGVLKPTYMRIYTTHTSSRPPIRIIEK